MTMINGLETGELDILDEDYYGPPPRFLRERRFHDFHPELTAEMAADREDSIPALQKLKTLLRAW